MSDGQQQIQVRFKLFLKEMYTELWDIRPWSIHKSKYFVSWNNPLTSRLTEIQTQSASQTVSVHVVHAWLVKSFASWSIVISAFAFLFPLRSMSV